MSQARSATSADADRVYELAAMMALSFTVEAEAFQRSFGAVLANPDAHLLVVDAEGRVAGYLLGHQHLTFNANGAVGWVEEIAVDAELRRRGLGRALMTEFERRTRVNGCRLTALATTRAGAFYASIGFERRADYYRKLLGE